MARNKFEKWLNNPLKYKIGPLSTIDEFAMLRKEMMRLRSIADKRIERSTEAGFDNILIGIDRTKPMTNKELKSLPKQKQRKELDKLRENVTELQKAMEKQLSSLSGTKEYLTATKGIDFSTPLTSAEKTIISTFKTNNNFADLQKHIDVQELIDAIDARTDLSDDEKADLKKFIRQKLEGEILDYDAAIPGMSIEELLEKYPEYQRILEESEAKIAARFDSNSNNFNDSPKMQF